MKGPCELVESETALSESTQLTVIRVSNCLMEMQGQDYSTKVSGCLQLSAANICKYKHIYIYILQH